MRPRDLLPQLARAPVWDERDASRALLLIATGLFKKLAIADYLGLNLVDRVFRGANPIFGARMLRRSRGLRCADLRRFFRLHGHRHWLGGAARCALPTEFRRTLPAHDIVDFWRRWHISLSTWLRDYLYIPLGGNRRGRAPHLSELDRHYVCLAACGTAEVDVRDLGWLARRRAGPQSRLARAGGSHGPEHRRRARGQHGRVHFTSCSWLGSFFRADSFRSARAVFGEIATFTGYHPNLDPRVLCVLALGLGLHFLPENLDRGARERFCGCPASRRAWLSLPYSSWCVGWQAPRQCPSYTSNSERAVLRLC